MTVIFFTAGEIRGDSFILRSYAEYCRLRGEEPKDLKVDRSLPKPSFSCPPYFSLSHSGGYTVCAMSDKPVGVDIQERKRVDFERISERFFGKRISDEREFFDEFTKAEATAKRREISLCEGMRLREGRSYELFEGYSLALDGDEEPVFFEL